VEGLGLLFGKVIVFVINKINLEYEALYPVLIFSIVLFTFSFTTFVNGNGFLAVYVAALYLGNKSFVHKKTVLKFFDGISWLFQNSYVCYAGSFGIP
jgi:potassium/hydrogen antiporter